MSPAPENGAVKSHVTAPVVFEVAVMVNFVIAYFFVWKERISERSVRSFWRHFAAYNAAGIGAFLLKFAAMQGLHFLFVSLGWLQGHSYEPERRTHQGRGHFH